MASGRTLPDCEYKIIQSHIHEPGGMEVIDFETEVQEYLYQRWCRIGDTFVFAGRLMQVMERTRAGRRVWKYIQEKDKDV